MRTEAGTTPQSAGLVVTTRGDVFEARMPAARNRWFVIAAIVFGFPWLVGYAGLSVAIVVGATEIWRGVLTWMMLTLLTILIDVVAAAAIWAAAYALWGEETLTVDPERATVRRRALGVRIPFRAKRGVADHVAPLAGWVTGQSTPHPRLELRGASARLRFGAGLTEEEAATLEDELSQFLATTRGSDRPGS